MNRGQRLMSQGEAQRLHVLKMVLEEKLTLVEASERMGVSYRQGKRLLARLRGEGPEGLIHGNRGRCPPNRLTDEQRRRILELASEKYASYNDSHLCELLLQEEKIRVGRETVRRLRREAGIAPKHRRRPRKHHRRRPRKAQAGAMMIWDGSPHAWFGSRAPACCLLPAVDDATGAILAAQFMARETSEGYLRVLGMVLRHHGIPLSVYQDCHSALHRNDDTWSLEEELAGRRDPTQVGRVLEELGIQPIFAHSPQAKGRVERLHKTLQDRWVPELEHLGIADLDTANALLDQRLVSEFNRRFAVAPEDAQRAFRPLPRGLDLERILSFRYQAKVGNDNAVRLGGRIIDIPPGPYRRSYALAPVEVRQLLDGTWRVYKGDRVIAKTQPTTVREPIRTLRRRKTTAKGSREALWVYPEIITEGTFSLGS